MDFLNSLHLKAPVIRCGQLILLLAGISFSESYALDTLVLSSSLQGQDTITNSAVMFKISGDFFYDDDTLEANNLTVHFKWLLINSGTGDTLLDSAAQDTIRFYPIEDGDYSISVQLDIANLNNVVIETNAVQFTVFTKEYYYTAKTWKMFSLPRKVTTTTVQDLFGSQTVWLFSWDENLFKDRGGYINDVTNILKPGKAYWLRTEQSGMLSLASSMIESSSVITIPLTEGWNQIANPYSFNITWEQAFFIINGLDTSLIVKSNIRDKPQGIWEWDPDNGYRLGGILKDSLSYSVMRPWSGYWVYSTRNQDIILHNTPFFNLNSNGLQQTKPKTAAAGEWIINLNAEMDGKSDISNYFGIASHASNEVGPEDLHKPPLPDLSYHTLYFGEGLAKDIKAESEMTSWEITVKSEKRGKVTLRWNDTKTMPHKYRLLLLDPEYHRWVNMLTQTSYEFQKRTFQKELKLYATTNSDIIFTTIPDHFEMAALSPNPFTSEVRLTFIPPLQALDKQIQFTVHTAQGAPVYTEIMSTIIPGKSHEVSWNGKTSAGKVLPPGIYFYRIQLDSKATVGKMLKSGY